MHDAPVPSGGLTVGEVAARLDVTIRTLHHWDEVGLARPSLRTSAGYRLYTDRDVERLQRVLVYRELGLGLTEIGEVLDDTSSDVTAALRAQRSLVAQRLARLQQLDVGLERMIEAHERGLLLTAEQQAEIFGPAWDPGSPVEAAQRYGGSPQWRQYAELAAARDAEDWREVVDEMGALERSFATAVDDGVAPGSAEADALVERHRTLFSSSFFPLTRQMQVCLGRMYVSEPGFTAHYDAVRPGLATWLRESIDASARTHGIDPDTAEWR